jgi:hypothetical protein
MYDILNVLCHLVLNNHNPHIMGGNMSSARPTAVFLMLVFFSLPGLIDGQEMRVPDIANSQPSSAQDLPEVLGVCEAAYWTILDLGPRKSDGRLDTDMILSEGAGPRYRSTKFPAPKVVRGVFPNHPPDSVDLRVFDGEVFFAYLIWEENQNDNTKTWDSLFSYLTLENGSPTSTYDGGQIEWESELITTVLSWSDDRDYLWLGYVCAPNQDRFYAALEDDPPQEEDSTTLSADLQGRTLPNPWRTASIVEILASMGEPSEIPHELENGVVGLHYRNTNSGILPIEDWFWFYEGAAIYTGSVFPLLHGISEAVESFEMLREVVIEATGEPDENFLGEEDVRQRMIWRQGSQVQILTFIVDSSPRVLLELFNSKHVDKINTDARPLQSLPRRVKPSSS